MRFENPGRPVDVVTAARGLVSFWTFQEPAGSPRAAVGSAPCTLTERGGPVARADDGVFGVHSAALGEGEHTAPWLAADRGDCGSLNFYGPAARLSVVAWVKRRRVPGMEWSCQAVAGMWNEHERRQYCLFLNLRIHDSGEQVGAHVSHVGGPTPGERYCMDAAIGATPVPFDRWACVAITYDGEHARAYLDGRLDGRGDRNPYHYPHGIFDGGPGGADFTVGAVARPRRVEMTDGRRVDHGTVQSNLYRGLLGGLAVFDRALDDSEIAILANATLP